MFEYFGGRDAENRDRGERLNFYRYLEVQLDREYSLPVLNCQHCAQDTTRYVELYTVVSKQPVIGCGYVVRKAKFVHFGYCVWASLV